MMLFPFNARTECGPYRGQNQDYYLLDPSVGFFSIADGMGGYDSGGYASVLACQHFFNQVEPLLPLKDSRVLWSLARSTIKHVYQESRNHPTIHKMGTTLTAVMVNPDIQRAFIVHIGDSRVYQLKGRHDLRQLTEDHTRAMQLVKSGVMTPSQARISTDRHRLTKCVGTSPNHNPDIFEIHIEKDDRFILSTDGFHDYMESEEIRRLMYAGVDAHDLVDIAIKNGSRDNVTVVNFDS